MSAFEIIMAIINAVAIISIPITAVYVGQKLQDRSEKRKDKMAIFQCLMTHRATGWAHQDNSIDSDYSKCVTDYCNRQREFHNHTSFLNIWLSCQREEEEINRQNAVVLRDFKIAQLFSEISIAKVESKQVIDEKLLMAIFPNAYNIENSKIDTTSAAWADQKAQQIFRGKFEMEFLRKILESIVIANKAHTYFSEVHNCVHLNPGSNMLSSLSVYADTPTCLVSFLIAHKRAVS